jgi:crotonobetainyl-CoA:carnitine CoA-transferase CaiB-like acyl-CoA transferase
MSGKPARYLDGIRVLDFTQTLAGPHCTWLLSCLGADVVKVESPTGDYIRPTQGGALFANVNRNKRSLVLDLRQEAGRHRAFALAARFDVVVESFKPGTMRRFGLSYEDVKAENPRVVYASISGFGQDGPYAARPGYDVIAQARSGLMAATGEPDRPPVRVPSGLIDYGTGAYTALSIVAALHRRSVTGLGCRIDASLLDTAMTWMSYSYTRYALTGESLGRMGSANETFVPYQVFQVRDGDVFVGVATDAMFQAFCAEFGLADLAADPSLATIAGRCEHRERVVAATAKALAPLPAAEVVSRLLRIDIPVTEILDIGAVLRDEHVLARGSVTTVRDPRLGEIVVTPFPVRMDGPFPPDRPAPTLGQHNSDFADVA